VVRWILLVKLLVSGREQPAMLVDVGKAPPANIGRQDFHKALSGVMNLEVQCSERLL
jgi:hypothetical protein